MGVTQKGLVRGSGGSQGEGGWCCGTGPWPTLLERGPGDTRQTGKGGGGRSYRALYFMLRIWNLARGQALCGGVETHHRFSYLVEMGGRGKDWDTETKWETVVAVQEALKMEGKKWTYLGMI